MSSNLEIFFSYAWGDEHEPGESRERIVNELYDSLVKDNYRVVRDKYNLEYKGFISAFMSRIGKGKCIIVAISQKYVKSPYCMFELYEIARNSNFDKEQFREKVLPVMVEFIDFTNPLIIGEHFSFWENKYKEWDDLVRKSAGQLSGDQMQRYDKIKMIYQNFGRLAEWIIDMNTLNPQLLSAGNFAEIKKAIIKKGIPDSVPDNGLIKKPVFWIAIVAVVTTIILIAFPLNGKNPPNSQDESDNNAVHFYNVVRPANKLLLIVQDTNNKRFGYAWAKDTILFISCKYDEANPFIEGMARVKNSGKYHWIKPDSMDAFKGEFDHAEDFQNGKAKVINGKDSFYIDSIGGRLSLPSEKTVIKKQGGKKTVSDTISEPPLVIPMCKGICDTKNITGVEVSFRDPKNGKKYSQESRGNELEFDIPCYLLEKSVSVTFKKNDQSETRNVRLRAFEIPELFRSN